MIQLIKNIIQMAKSKKAPAKVAEANNGLKDQNVHEDVHVHEAHPAQVDNIPTLALNEAPAERQDPGARTRAFRN